MLNADEAEQHIWKEITRLVEEGGGFAGAVRVLLCRHMGDMNKRGGDGCVLVRCKDCPLDEEKVKELSRELRRRFGSVKEVNPRTSERLRPGDDGRMACTPLCINDGMVGEAVHVMEYDKNEDTYRCSTGNTTFWTKAENVERQFLVGERVRIRKDPDKTVTIKGICWIPARDGHLGTEATVKRVSEYGIDLHENKWVWLPVWLDRLYCPR